MHIESRDADGGSVERRCFPSRKKLIRSVSVLCLAACLNMLPGRTDCRGGDFHNALSFQGYTGLLNTPNAELTGEGFFYGGYSNQKEYVIRDRTAREESYFASFGFFSFAEISGRLTDAPGLMRDLSANVKIKVPFLPQGRELPDLAVGAQDLGGGSRQLHTKYVVATEQWKRLRLSLGFGTGPDRMKGMFGGAEIKAFDWLYVIGENDAQENNIGVRLLAPTVFGLPVAFQATAKKALDERAVEWGFGFQAPLGSDSHRAELPRKEGEAKGPISGATGPEESLRENGDGVISPVKPKELTHDGGVEPLRALQEKLASEGFENVRVGARAGELLVVEYENRRYNHNELDGLGVVLGLVTDAMPGGFETLRLIIKKEDIRMLRLSAPLGAFRSFLHEQGAYADLNEKLEISTAADEDDSVGFITGPVNASWLKPSVVISPGLKTYLGTEVGVFDYLLSAKVDTFMNTWKGAALNARWDVPVFWSENFDDGEVFRRDRKNSRLDRLMLFQAIKATPDIMFHFGAGMVLREAYGTLNEVMWTFGNHRLSARQAALVSQDTGDRRQKREMCLGSYRYYYSPLDLSFKGTGGRFLDEDEGFAVEMKRFFGDTSLSAYYKNSRTNRQEREQVAGLMLSLPLTPRRDMNAGPVQVRGPEEWSYFQETKLVSPGESNFVTAAIGDELRVSHNLERVFFNRDRLSEAYIRTHLLRLREAYLVMYREQE